MVGFVLDRSRGKAPGRWGEVGRGLFTRLLGDQPGVWGACDASVTCIQLRCAGS
jgi:hypothetical protein